MTKLPSIAEIKKFLYADWALRVKQRDGFKCLLCGATENLTAHHWYVCDHHAHAARYSVDNGATLCYACHIRGVHQRADYFTVRALFNIIRQRPGFDVCAIERLAATELTTSLLRSFWDARRAVPVHIADSDASLDCVGKKTFVRHWSGQRVVVGNTLKLGAFKETFEVLVVAKAPQGFWRYTVKRLEENE